MNRVFDYLRLALKGRTKTPGQRLRASQLSYRMLGRVFPPSLPNLNTTVAFSILAMEACIYPGAFAIKVFVFVYSLLRLELFTMYRVHQIAASVRQRHNHVLLSA